MKRYAFVIHKNLSVLFLVIALIGYAGFRNLQEAWRSLSANSIGAEYLDSRNVVYQTKRNNCGPSVMKMILEYNGIDVSVEEIEKQVVLTEHGLNMNELHILAGKFGISSEGWVLTANDLLTVEYPVILFVNGQHFITADSIGRDGIYLRDPSLGRIKLPLRRLNDIWNGETLIFRHTIKRKR